MFHKAKTEKDRQQIFDDYFLGILKDKKVIETNQKIIDESGFSYDPELENNQIKGTFDSYVDTLVIKNYMIEQLQSRLKISKSLATQFVNKLNGNELLILSKNLNEFIKYLEDTYNNINDYILRSSFNVLQSNYNITQQKEKNKEIVKDYQTETGQTINENIPAEQLEQAEEEGMDETIPPTPATPRFTEERQKFVSFLNKTIFKVKGTRGVLTAPTIKKNVLSEVLYGKPNSFVGVPSTKINPKYIDELIPLIENDENKRDMRLAIQERIKGIFLNSSHIPNIIQALKVNRNLFSDEIVGNGYGVVNHDPYITIGKYLVHKQHLLGSKLQVRSPVNHNQVYGFKSQNITNNIKDILLKLHKKEPISFKDVDKLNEEEKNQLYMIGKRLHVSDLFDIPSTTKSNEDKLKDEFYLLRGSIMAGNNNPQLLRKFKIVLLKMKNNKLISLQEYNEILNIMLELDI
jgi:hypothetical protein